MEETPKTSQNAISTQISITQKIWREIKRPFRQLFGSSQHINPSCVYNKGIPREGIKYIGNDEFGITCINNLMQRQQKLGYAQHPDTIVTNQSVGKYFILDAKRIANVGSGIGAFEYNIATKYPDILFVASEFGTGMTEWCKQNRPLHNVIYCSDDIDTLQQTYGKFDLAVNINVIEHIKDYGLFLSKFVQLADRAVVTTPNRDANSYRHIAEWQAPINKEHVYEFNAGELYFLLKAFYKNVELYTLPDLDKPELIPIGIYSSHSMLFAHCNNN